MATKTITLKLEAYNRLKAARRYPTESFSEVVLRANWPSDTATGRDLVRLFRNGWPQLPKGVAERIAAAKAADKAPVDKWAKR